MKWIPASLFGRLMVVLVLGLTVAQLLAAGVLLADRGRALYEAGDRYAVRRIVSIVQVLDSATPEDRRLLLRAVNTPALRVIPAPAARVRGPQEAGRAYRVARLLTRALGGDRPVRVRLDGDSVAVDRRKPAPPAVVPFGRGGTAIFSFRWPGWSNQPPLTPHWEGAPGWGQRREVVRPHLGQYGMSVWTVLKDGSGLRFQHRPVVPPVALSLKLLGVLAILLVAVVLVSLFAVRRVTQPFTMLARAARDLGDNLQRPPLAEVGPNEVRQTVVAFNAMQARIQRQMDERSHMLAAVSHDLKTPITRLRLRAEMLDDDVAQAKFTRDLDDMETMVNSTLDLMGGVGRAEPVGPTDLNALLESLQEDMQATGAEVTLSGRTGAPVMARPVALRRCFANLVENAVKYGDRADIEVVDCDTSLTVSIADRGPGIGVNELETVFEPYRRLESSRNRDTGGTGLGLAIARSVARIHGGDVILENRAEGGLVARVELPHRHSG